MKERALSLSRRQMTKVGCLAELVTPTPHRRQGRIPLRIAEDPRGRTIGGRESYSKRNRVDLRAVSGRVESGCSQRTGSVILGARRIGGGAGWGLYRWICASGWFGRFARKA